MSARTLEQSLAVALGVPCRICNAKIDERCTSLHNASKYREPHADRLVRARSEL